MPISALPAAELSPRQLTSWSQFQQDDPALASPFFRPEYTQLVASLCDDVEVAILEESGEAIGFLPFHRDRCNIAHPVGLTLSDYQGIIARHNASWNAQQFLQDCCLRAWHFNRALACQPAFRANQWFLSDATYIDLSSGYQVYARYQQSRGHHTLARLHQKVRKLQREVGTLHLVPHTADGAVFLQLLQWKTEQYRRIGCRNYLASEWTVELLRRVLAEQSAMFSGMLSVLYAGDDLVALHLGMRSKGVLHGWFPAYNPAFAKYSPGLLLWLQLAEQSAELGIRIIDFGRGDERYKKSLSTGTVRVAEGSLDTRRLASAVRWGVLKARELVRASPFRGPIQSVVRGFRSHMHY